MKTGSDTTELEDFKREATIILEDEKIPVHKWESKVEELDDEANPRKIHCILEGSAWSDLSYSSRCAGLKKRGNIGNVKYTFESKQDFVIFLK